MKFVTQAWVVLGFLMAISAGLGLIDLLFFDPVMEGSIRRSAIVGCGIELVLGVVIMTTAVCALKVGRIRWPLLWSSTGALVYCVLAPLLSLAGLPPSVGLGGLLAVITPVLLLGTFTAWVRVIWANSRHLR